MSNAVLLVNFAFGDSTFRGYSMGNFDVNSDAVDDFKDRLRKFNSVDTSSGKKYTNLADVLKSDNGASLTGIKSASINIFNIQRIYDSATYRQ